MILMCSLCLISCVSVIEKPMPPIKVNSYQIMFHSQNSADLVWKTGKVFPSNSGYENKVDIYQYGKISQESFMQSLRDNLLHAHAYKSIRLTKKAPTFKQNHTIITIDFLKTSVGETIDCFPVHITVRVTMQDNRGKVARRIFVYSKAGSAFSHKSFRDQQIEVSRKLMRRVIHIINQREKSK